MRLHGEILQGEEGVGARCILLVGGGGYFEGVKSVGEFSSERLVLFFARESVEIDGESFVIKKYCDGDLELSGKILSWKIADGSEK